MRCKTRTVPLSLFTLLAVGLAGPPPAAGEACHRVAQWALTHAIRHEPVTRDDLRGCWGVLHGHVRGSENIPVLSTAAGVISGLQPATDMRPLLLRHEPWPPGEVCSPIYGSWIALSVLSVHNRADAPKMFFGWSRQYLRAFWTLLTLQASREIPLEVEVRRPGRRAARRSTLTGKFRGVWLHCPGMRATEDDDAWWFDHGDLHGLLSAALGISWRPRRPLDAAEPGRPQWALAAANELAGGGLWPASPPASFWGLTEDERSELRAFLEEPTLERARLLVRWARPLRPQRGVTRTIIRFEGGGTVGVQSVETNRVKATQSGFVVAGHANGLALRVAASHARVHDDHIVVRSGEVREEISLLRFGREVFRILGDSERWWVLNSEHRHRTEPAD